MKNFFNNNIGYFAMLMAVIGFGSGPPFVTLALKEFFIIDLLAVRFLIAFFLMLFFCIVMRVNLSIKEVGLKPFLMGLLNPFLVTLSFHIGLLLTSPVNGVAIISTLPLMQPFVAKIFLNEKIGVKKFIGIALGFIGALVLVLQGTENSLRAPNVSLGNFLFLLNSIFFSSFIIMVKPLTQKYNTITIMKWLFFMGFFMTLPVTTEQFDEIDWVNLPFDAIWRITFVVLGTTFLTYFLNLFALKKLQASTVGAFAYAQPIIAISFAIITGNDYLSLERGIACLIIIFGVYLVSQKSNKN